jgi:hypothetical protein
MTRSRQTVPSAPRTSAPSSSSAGAAVLKPKPSPRASRPKAAAIAAARGFSLKTRLHFLFEAPSAHPPLLRKERDQSLQMTAQASCLVADWVQQRMHKVIRAAHESRVAASKSLSPRLCIEDIQSAMSDEDSKVTAKAHAFAMARLEQYEASRAEAAAAFALLPKKPKKVKAKVTEADEPAAAPSSKKAAAKPAAAQSEEEEEEE